MSDFNNEPVKPPVPCATRLKDDGTIAQARQIVARMHLVLEEAREQLVVFLM
jgi:hypothetical protein